MALWAKLMTVATAFAVALTGAGVILLWFTLKETAEGVDAMRQEQRAWLSIGLKAVSDLTFKDGEGRLAFEFSVKNHGASPAIFANILAECSAKVFGEFETLNILRTRTSRPENSKGVGRFSVFPGSEEVRKMNMPFP